MPYLTHKEMLLVYRFLGHHIAFDAGSGEDNDTQHALFLKLAGYFDGIGHEEPNCPLPLRPVPDASTFYGDRVFVAFGPPRDA